MFGVRTGPTTGLLAGNGPGRFWSAGRINVTKMTFLVWSVRGWDSKGRIVILGQYRQLYLPLAYRFRGGHVKWRKGLARGRYQLLSCSVAFRRKGPRFFTYSQKCQRTGMMMIRKIWAPCRLFPNTPSIHYNPAVEGLFVTFSFQFLPRVST